MKNKDDHFELLRKIQKKPESSQRELAEELGFILGKLNYCLKPLKKKNLIKINNFKKNKNKINYIYVLTPRGIDHRLKLTLKFVKEKIKNMMNLKQKLKININLNDQLFKF